MAYTIARYVYDSARLKAAKKLLHELIFSTLKNRILCHRTRTVIE